MSKVLPLEFFNKINSYQLSFNSELSNYKCNYSVSTIKGNNLIRVENEGKATLEDIKKEFDVIDKIVTSANYFDKNASFIIIYDSRKVIIPSIKVRKLYLDKINSLVKKGRLAYVAYIENRKNILAFSKILINFIPNLKYSIHPDELEAEKRISVFCHKSKKLKGIDSAQLLHSKTLPDWSYTSPNGKYKINVALLGNKIIYTKAKGHLSLNAIEQTFNIYDKVIQFNGKPVDFSIVDMKEIKSIARDARKFFQDEKRSESIFINKAFCILPPFAKSIFRLFKKFKSKSIENIELAKDFETAFQLCQGVKLEETLESSTNLTEETLESLKSKYQDLQQEFDDYKKDQNTKIEQLISMLGSVTWNDSFNPSKVEIDEKNPFYDLFETSWILQNDIKEILETEKDINKSLNSIVVTKKKEIDSKENNLRSIINNTDKIIFLLDKKFNVVEANNLFYQYFKKVIKKEVAIGDNIIEALNGNTLKAKMQEWFSYALTGKNAIYQIENNYSQIHFTHEYYIFPIIEEENVERISVRIVDISEKKRAEKQLLDQNEALKKVNTELDQFVYSVSHDLRAPLTSLMGLISLAKKEENIDSIKEFIALQEKSVIKLDEFIQDIINLARNARTEVIAEEINIETLLNNIFNDLQYAENSSLVEIEYDIHQQIKFRSDKSRLKIIFGNLISNALRYADLRKEKPQIKIQADIKEKEVIVKIQDNGQGIKKEHQKRIFDMFYRANTYCNGSGLGLYILNETIKKINGSVHVESEYGVGSTFTVNFPKSISKSKETVPTN